MRARRLSARVAALLALVALAAAPHGAGAQETPCRQALALGLDVSGSVNSAEYRLQLEGLAGALAQPDVRAALLAMPDAPVALLVFEWSGPDAQRLLVDWRNIDSAAALEQVIAQLLTVARRPAPPSTAIGAALGYGRAALARRPGCWKRTLDLSGDGKSNTGPHPREMRAAMQAAGITVNALVVAGGGGAAEDGGGEPGIAELSAYFRAYVLSGADAFVEVALGFADFEAAMARKLKRELQGLAMSGAGPDGAGTMAAPSGRSQ